MLVNIVLKKNNHYFIKDNILYHKSLGGLEIIGASNDLKGEIKLDKE